MSLAIVSALFSADASSLDAWRPILDSRVHVRIANRPPVLGLVPALEELEAFLAGVRSFGGRYRDVWELKDATLVETEVVCRTKPALPGAALPCAIIFRTGGGALALDVRLYLDPSPLLMRSRRSSRQANGH